MTLLGASSNVAGEPLLGDLGWRKLEERRKERKILFDKRLEDGSKQTGKDGSRCFEEKI